MAAHNLIADSWRNSHPFTTHFAGDFYRYNQQTGLWGIYPDVIVEQEIMAEILKVPTARMTGSLIGSVFRIARNAIAQTENPFDKRSDLLACKNGTLNLTTRKLSKHEPRNFLTSGVTFDYDPVAKAPAWERYLSRLEFVISDEVVSFLQEYAGLCITTETKYDTAVWLCGPAGSGKSTFIEGLLAVLKERSCTLSLSDLERSRFSLTNIPGKTLIIATEQPAKAVRSIDVVNKMISGELVQVERKNQHPFDVRPVCKLLWAMNTLPQIVEANSGIFRRVAVVEFPPLSESAREPGLRKEIMSEGPGILNWALDGLDRIRSANKLTVPDSIEESRKEFQRLSDVERMFIEDECKVKANEVTQALALYTRYAEWCKKWGHKPKPAHVVGRDWKRLGFGQKHNKLGTLWIGLKLK